MVRIPIRIVGYGCGDETPDLALKETRRLMEQLKADILIGPLSGDEGIAVANYAKAHPNKTFLNGTSGALDTTLKVRAKNFFRWNGDGAMWNAGTGELAYKRLGWRKAAIIMDDYGFGWTSAAGLIADFCSWGGEITKRVFPPLGTTDYASFIQQLPPPDQVDGYFWVVGGTGTVASLKAYEQAYGQIDPKKFIGNLFFAFFGNDKEVAPRLNGAFVGGFGTAPALKTKQAKAYEAIIGKWFKQFPPTYKPAVNGAADGFVYNYYNAAWALTEALKAVKGDLSGGQRKLQQALVALGKKGLPAGYGTIYLDANRQAIQDQYPLRLTVGPSGAVTSVIGLIRRVNQSFGGTFSPAKPAPGRNAPACEKRPLPWHNKIVPVNNGVIRG